MMDIPNIERAFVRNFIRRERRERSIHKLQHKTKRTDFLDKFNHSWSDMLIEKKLISVNVKSDRDTFLFLKERLHREDSDLCYVISYRDSYRQLLPFKEAIEECQSNGYAGLLVGKEGKCFYLKTEQVKGAPERFIGISN